MKKKKKKRTIWGTNYLSQLVVDHHIVGFNVTVHDAHTVTVVQSLADTMSPHQQEICCYLVRNSGNISYSLNVTFQKVKKKKKQTVSPSVVHTYRNGYHNLSTSGTTPVGEEHIYISI